MKLSKTLTVGVVGAFLALASPGQASVVTFDDVTLTDVNNIYTNVTSGGFNFVGEHFHIIDNPAIVSAVENGTYYLAAEAYGDLGKAVTMSRIGGDVFSLTQLDIAEVWLPDDIINDFMSVTLFGTQLGGGLLKTFFVLDGIRDGAGDLADFQTVFLIDWTNLVSLTISGSSASGGFGDFAVDNIHADVGQVPIPAALPLFAVGLSAMGFMGWRKKRKAVA